ncbi:hypothetical protein ACOMHN_006274 [Nucella lapillus]
MSVKPRPSRPRHKPRPRSRPRLFLPSPLPLPQVTVQAHWAPQLRSLEEIVQDYPLPQLVLCRTQGLRTRDGGPMGLPLDKPIMLVSQRSARHLLARTVMYDNRNKGFNESSDSVVIPEDYDGHFLRLQSRTTKDKTKVKSLDAIAHDDTPAFLNLSDMTVFPAQPRDQNDQSRFIYTVGNVFLVDEPLPPEETYSAVSDSSRQKSPSTTTSRRNGNGLMKCLDERGMAIMVPTNQMGEMVTVQSEGSGQPRLSVKSSDMMVNQQFPLLARYAYGKRTPRLTAFSKLLTLLDSFQETSVIACVINSSSIMLMEIPMTSSLTFQVALNIDDLLKVPRMRRALEVGQSQGYDLSRDIKFKYKFSHRVQETSRRMMKLKQEDDLPSATVRTRLVVTESYIYI